jgi:hypothetical protein
LNVPRSDPRWLALRRLRPPAFMLMNVAIINIAYALVMAAVIRGYLPVPQEFANSIRGQTSWEAPLKIFGALATSTITLFAAWNAFNLRRWGLVVLGAATAVITPTPVCFVGFPFAAWMFWVLSMPEVRQHFT